jgi:hypothetical protein
MSRVEIAPGDPAAEAADSATQHRKRGIVTALAVFLVLLLLAWRMVPHPVGPARTYDKYRGKAVTTAEAAESEVQAALLMARTASAGNSFGPYAALVISDAEDSLGGLQGTFDSLQPPDERADALGRDLDGVLGDALQHVHDLRLAARRGQLHDLAAIARPLPSDIRKLQSFQEQHS